MKKQSYITAKEQRELFMDSGKRRIEIFLRKFGDGSLGVMEAKALIRKLPRPIKTSIHKSAYAVLTIKMPNGDPRTLFLGDEYYG